MINSTWFLRFVVFVEVTSARVVSQYGNEAQMSPLHNDGASTATPGSTTVLLAVAFMAVIVGMTMLCGLCGEHQPVAGPVACPVAAPQLSPAQRRDALPIESPTLSPSITEYEPMTPSDIQSYLEKRNQILCADDDALLALQSPLLEECMATLSVDELMVVKQRRAAIRQLQLDESLEEDVPIELDVASPMSAASCSNESDDGRRSTPLLINTPPPITTTPRIVYSPDSVHL